MFPSFYTVFPALSIAAGTWQGEPGGWPELLLYVIAQSSAVWHNCRWDYQVDRLQPTVSFPGSGRQNELIISNTSLMVSCISSQHNLFIFQLVLFVGTQEGIIEVHTIQWSLKISSLDKQKKEVKMDKNLKRCCLQTNVTESLNFYSWQIKQNKW